jgi:PAS domain-containing protein
MQRSEATVGMLTMRGSPIDEILSRALEGAVELTKSKVGYIAIFNRSTKKIKMISWSLSAMAECRTDRKPRIYDLDKTGIWGEPLRTMKSVVVNDYASEPSYRKKGTPPGHVKLERLMMIPAVVNGVPVGTAGVANKATDYTEEDEEQFRRFIGNFFTFYQQDIEEDAKKITEGRMIGLIDIIPIGIATLNTDGSFIKANLSANNYLAPPGEEVINRSLSSLEGEGPEMIRSLIGKINGKETTKSGYFMKSGIDIYATVTALTNDGNPAGWLISLIDVSALLRSAGRYRPARTTIRHFATYAGHVISSIDDDIEDLLMTTGEGEERKLLEEIRSSFVDLIRYFRTESSIAQRLPVWQRLSDCVVKPPQGFRVENRTGDYSILADPIFPSIFDMLYEVSLVHGSVSATVSASEDGEGNLVVAYVSEGYGATEYVGAILGSTSDGLSSVTARDIAEASGFGFEYIVGNGVLEVRITVPAESYSKGN